MSDETTAHPRDNPPTLAPWDVMNYRARALELAHHNDLTPAQVVERAGAYAAFLFDGAAPKVVYKPSTAPVAPAKEPPTDPQPEEPVKPARQSRTKKEPSPTATATTPSSTTSSTAATSASPDVATLRAKGKDTVMAIAKKHGRDTAVELLSKFDATAVSTMDEAKLPGFLPVADAVLAGTAIEDALALADAPLGDGEEDLSDLG